MLKESLDNEGIPYTVADDGFIMYSGKYRDDVERIKKSLEEKRFKEVGIQFEDEATTKYFRTLLDERGIKYRTVPEKDGEWTYWLPENEQQLDELYQKAISHDCETGNERKDSN